MLRVREIIKHTFIFPREFIAGNVSTRKKNFLTTREFTQASVPIHVLSAGKESSDQSHNMTSLIHLKYCSVNRSTDPYNREDSFSSREEVPIADNSLSCLECGRCFTQKRELLTHWKTHKTKLDIHQRIHTGEYPNSCPQCGNCFTEKADLVTHQETHKSGPPYSCSECGKCFRDKAKLVIHQRIHTGERPFSCLECGKCFSRKDYLVKHQKNHMGEGPFSC
ncbi:hypothetical protein AB205_0084140 [Aquarana catesbeiana]|uniref:C2H2-type domain-containing protein n=1 Tax=Aquarana catesbeiana TaxID=8400 RepID=A0A2G9S8A5_AQUCT|nr:hypothetical protein AB205_0084140 [Aquarana catesbeiana]